MNREGLAAGLPPAVEAAAMEATTAMEASAAMEATAAVEAAARAAAAETCPPAHGSSVLERAAVHVRKGAFRAAAGTRMRARLMCGRGLRDMLGATGVPC